MFTIDLLKGQGIPMKSRPGGIAISAVAVAAPVIIAIVMLGIYLHKKIIISVNKQDIARQEAEIDKLSDLIKQLEGLEKEKAACGECLSEVKSSTGRYAQWSPVLATVVENMPGSVMLTGLEVKQHSIKRKVPKKEDPKKTVDIDVPVRTLTMSVCASAQSDGDKAVRDFQARLRSSAFLGPKLENITVSQEAGTLDKQDVVIYEINCIFKPGL
jgi:Tfp pilus assembly protein PilN